MGHSWPLYFFYFRLFDTVNIKYKICLRNDHSTNGITTTYAFIFFNMPVSLKHKIINVGDPAQRVDK